MNDLPSANDIPKDQDLLILSNKLSRCFNLLRPIHKSFVSLCIYIYYIIINYIIYIYEFIIMMRLALPLQHGHTQ